MNFEYEQKNTPDGMEIKVTTYVEKPKIQISKWPKFTVTWMGTKMEGRFIAPGVYQLGAVVVFRNAQGDYVELAPDVYVRGLRGEQAESADVSDQV